jgi:hypothetical protein
MAYGKRYRSYRKGRRGTRTLTTRRIFNNKSAKAQASQIYALKRRINRVYRATKPEVKVVETLRTERMLLPNMDENVVAFDFVRPSIGTADDQRVGSMIHMVQPTLFISAKYDSPTRSNPAPIYNQQLLRSGAAMRIIAIQSKFALNIPPTINEILHSNISTSFQGVDNIANLRIPFEIGISTRFAIIYDKVKFFSFNKPILSQRINFKPKIKNLKWNPESGGGSDETYVYPVGTIFVYLVQGGLESNNLDLNAEGVDFTRITFSYSQKLAYTDA